MKYQQRGIAMLKKLRVTLLLPFRGVGGGVRAIMRFANVLKVRGHEVRILARHEDASLKDKIRHAYLIKTYGESDWLKYAEVPVSEYVSLRDFSFSPDELVVAMCTRTSFDVMELDKGSCIPVYHCHGSELEDWENMLIAWNMPTKKISVCSQLATEMEVETGQKCYGVVPDGVDLAEYFPAGNELSRNAVGAGYHWTYTKDPVNTARVFEKIGTRCPSVPRIAFGSGKKPRALKGVEYTRLPTVEEARAIYSRCKVWFHTSIREGFGLPILEAMACGCALVATNSGGPSDMISNGENGFIVDVGNFGAMTHKIAQIFDDDALYGRLRENGLETAKRYSWEAAGALMEKKLMEIRAEALGG
jgi:hypothetical protein